METFRGPVHFYGKIQHMEKTISRQGFRKAIYFFALSFILHLLWENLQAPLFEGYHSFSQHFPMCLFATATGDMLFMLIIYLVLAMVHKNVWWMSEEKVYHSAATWILPVLIGSLIGISFELWAVYVDHRWIYGAMPMIPLIKVGLTPVLQMGLIPLVVIKIIEKSPAFFGSFPFGRGRVS